MPLYGFRCGECGAETEEFRRLADFDKAGPTHCAITMTRVISAPRVISDIEPYQAMGSDIATGKPPMITSRSQHREYLKRNGYQEVGNDRPAPVSKPAPDTGEIGRTIKRVMDDKGIRA